MSASSSESTPRPSKEPPFSEEPPPRLWPVGVLFVCGGVLVAALMIWGRPKHDAASEAAGRDALGETKNGVTIVEDADRGADDETTFSSGLGELRARRPGQTDETDRAVRLQSHAVKVRIAGNVARTEIDETFVNDSNDELEGIYRFPLPHGAQIERLALEVDGRLVDGAFVERTKAAAVFRGAIHHAMPKAPKPREEIVWVPGPWHDPALLEWTQGGRFELRIFPIPKRGSRRVVVAYTESLAPSSGLRRYTYPLPRKASGKPSIDDATFDVQVVGNDPSVPVAVRGYELTKTDGGTSAHWSMHARSFVPTGDLSIEYALADRTRDRSAWAYQMPDGDAFVALALRPTWPSSIEPRPRDHVIVVDTGRAMIGERFARARRLAVSMAREMDGHDRLTVLACDVSCRALSRGFVIPGATAAQDVEAFLGAESQDGASDLVGAVRAATEVQGHDRTRDLRVVLVSGGAATAGYRSRDRLAQEVRDAVVDARTEVVTVPLGVDADADSLAEIARGGGGVVVPYGPGQRVDAVAREVLNAAHGTVLRDVSVTLPEGLCDVSPSVLAPIRAGAETLVAARMVGTSIQGDVVLRGNVGGEPFEARYPLQVQATSDPGNAFVPRLFATARIADLERDGGAASRDSAVALSKRFSVPSSYTSLLVLESEAMFKAFGIDRTALAETWTGESSATDSARATAEESTKTGSRSDDEERDERRSVGNALGAGAASAPSPKKGESSRAMPSRAMPSSSSAALDESAAPTAPSRSSTSRPPRVVGTPFDDLSRFASPGRYMKRIYVRRATLSAVSSSAKYQDKIDAARRAVDASPDERAKRKDLVKWLARASRLDELQNVLAAWSSRDPLDVDVIFGRADLEARRGNREEALRTLGGALASSMPTPTEAFGIVTTIARAYERLGRSEACAFRITAAELRPSSDDALAAAVACERRAGHRTSAERFLDGLSDARRRGVLERVRTVEATSSETVVGDIVVSATTADGDDLDLAIIDPSGRRAAVVTRLANVRASLGNGRRPIVAFSAKDAGTFLVEVTRPSSSRGSQGPRGPFVLVRGEIRVSAFGQTRTFPFVVSDRTDVAQIDLRWEPELVPLDEPWRDPPRRRPVSQGPVIFHP